MLKTILTFFLFFHFILMANARGNFHVSSSFATQQGSISKEVAATVTIRNLTNKTIQLKWEVSKTNLSEGWQAVVCDHQCYTSITKEHTFSLAPNQILHDFKVSFRPNGKEGIGTLEINLYEPSNEKSSKETITFSGAAHGVISSPNKFSNKMTSAPKVFPNPAIEYISIKDEQEQVRTIEIYNVVGRMLKLIKVNHSGEKYDISRLPRGMYMVRMLDAKGTIVRTQRISKHNP